jgi:putative CocE/NonD family hydrolase
MKPGQKVTGRYQLWDGPFTHLSGSAVNTDELELRWFDTWLKHKPTGMAKTRTPLHYYDLGTQKYHQTTTYPFTGVHGRRFFLSAGDTLRRHRHGKGKGKDDLVYSPVGSPCGASVDQWAIGPLRGAEQIGGFENLPCVDDASATPAGPTILKYTSPAMKHARTLAGPIAARIFARATTKNTQWVAEISDVSPGGRAQPLTEGALLGSLRATVKHRNWRAPHHQLLLPYHRYSVGSARNVKPGRLTRYDIEIYPTLDTIAKGHRIRITLTTADTPHLQPSAPVASDLLAGIYRIKRGGHKASSVTLPLGHVKLPFAFISRHLPPKDFAPSMDGDCGAGE